MSERTSGMELLRNRTVIYTIGHSTRTIEEFLELLREHEIRTLADVRRFPGSRRYPQFGSEALARALAQAGIAYRHVEALGGRRRPRPDSPNDAWRNPQFRGYADHMDTPEFGSALAALLQAAADSRLAIMCAEAVPWQCHRQLISDALVARGVRVVHILEPGKTSDHELSEHARVTRAGRVAYPGNAAQLDLL